MRLAAASAAATRPVGRPRCRCGHLPTHHMEVVAVGGTASFQLKATGPCALCGEAVCHRYSPGGT